MRSFAVSAAFALAAVLPAVQAGGNAIINNKCAFEVSVWPIDINRNPAKPIVLAPGQTYSEPYHTPDHGGVSIKIGDHQTPGGPVTQFEYTVAGDLFYDVSNIDCSGESCPFQKYGMYLESGSSCPSMSCPAGAPVCDGAYNQPDDVRTFCCTEDSPNTTLHLCVESAGKARSAAAAAVHGARHVEKARRALFHAHARRHS